MKTTILAIGGIYVDINCHGVDYHGSMPAEAEIDGADYEIVAGGSGVNFGRLCRQLGMSPSFIGKTGRDHMGELVEQLLTETGIAPLLIRDETVQTQVAINLVNDAGETIMPGAGDANAALTGDEVLALAGRHMADMDYLYLGSCLKLKRLLPAYGQLVELAHKHGVQVVVDHGRGTSSLVDEAAIRQVRQLVEQADIYVPSTEEFLAVWDCPTIDAGLQRLTEQKPQRIVVVKDGADGAHTWLDGRRYSVAAHKVPARFMVGAGDSFNAGLIAGLARGRTLPDSMAYGAAVAALKISGQSVSPAAAEQLITR